MVQQANRAQILPEDRKSAKFDVSKLSSGSGETPYADLLPAVTLLLNRWVFEQQAQLIGNHRLRTGNVSQAVPHT
jgi:hypothetical protein